jgi:hypothetical protein
VNAPVPAVRRLGRRLLLRELEQEAAGGDRRRDVAAVAVAAERATRKLAQPLRRLVGVAGCQALLTRALHTAGWEWPLLDRVRAVATPAGGLEDLGAALQGTDPARARAALGAVLAHLVWLLVTFVGADLALRAVREAWPDVRLGPDDLAPAGRPRERTRSPGGGPRGTEATA